MNFFLTDTDAIGRISQKLKQEDKSLWGKIKDFLHGLVEKLKAAYKSMKPDSGIAQTTRETIRRSEAILEAYTDAAAEAVMNYNLQDGQKNNAQEGERYSDRASKYSYEYFTEKADMSVTAVDETQSRDRESIIQAALRNAKKAGRTNENGNALVYVNDIGRDVIVGKKALAHGLDRRAGTQAPVLAKIGDVLKNAVKVNELNPRSESIKESYVLVGAARSETGLYVASFVVNQHSNEITSIDVLYAANAKKEPAALLPKITEESVTPTGSKISIAKLLDIVNELYPDILPEEVLKHYGHTERLAGKIGESALYSSRTATDSAGNALTEAQQKYFENSQVRDEDGNLKVVYHGSPAVFTEFSADFMSSHGSSEGQGFYFTDYKPMAEGYQKSGGQLLEGYLNIQKPLSDSEVTLKRSEVKKLLQALDPTGDDLVLNYDSGGGMGYPSRSWYNRALNDTLNTVMTNESDSEILGELANAMGNSGTVLEKVRDVLGYDGYIVSGKYDNANVYVAFDSSQFKNADNQNPTAARDIRYSSRTAADNRYMELARNPEGDRAKGRVNLTMPLRWLQRHCCCAHPFR